MKTNSLYFLILGCFVILFGCQSKMTTKVVEKSDRPIDPMAAESWQYQSKSAWAPPSKLDRGYKLCSEKKTLQAIREWQQKFQLHKQDNTYWYALGNCYSLSSQDQMAAYAYKVGLGINPKHVGIQHNLAILYMRQKDYQKAFPLISQVVKENPQSVLPQFHLAQVYYLFSNYVEAKNILVKLESIVPEQMDVKKWIAQSSYYLKDFASAKLYFEKLPSYVQKDMEVSNLYAHSLYEVGSKDKAYEVLMGDKSNPRTDLSEFREKLLKKIKEDRQLAGETKPPLNTPTVEAKKGGENAKP